MKTFSTYFTAFLLCGLSFAVEDKPPVKFDLTVHNDSLEAVLRMLSEKSGHAIFNSNVEDDTLITSLDLKQTTWREALERIAKDKNFTLAQNGAWGKLILLERTEPLSLKFKDADVLDVLNAWAVVSSRNIIVLPDVQGKVTVVLKDIPAKEALARIVAETKCEVIYGPFKTAIVLGTESVKKLAAARAAERAYVFGTTAAPDTDADKLVSLKQQNVSLEELLEDLFQKIKFRMSGDLTSWQPKITLEVNNIPARGVLELISRRYGIAIDEARGSRPRIFFDRVNKNESVSFIFNNAEIRDVINTIAIQASVNIVINNDVSGTVSTRLENVPAETAMSMILNPMGISFVREPENILHCLRAETLMKECSPVAKGQYISMFFNRAKLADIITVVVKQANADVKFDKDVITNEMFFTGHLNSVHWKQALIVILKSNGLRLIDQADGKYVITREASKP